MGTREREHFGWAKALPGREAAESMNKWEWEWE
jgi:hypothetical protein